VGASEWNAWRDYLTGQSSKLGIDAAKKLPGEGFKRPWPPLIKMDAAVKAKVEKMLGGRTPEQKR
jgi:3-polyprenyl-4-hydroxybenzoate decarboxylase